MKKIKTMPLCILTICFLILNGCGGNKEEIFSGSWICTNPKGEFPDEWKFDSKNKKIFTKDTLRGVEFKVYKQNDNQYWLEINDQKNRKAIFTKDDSFTIHDTRFNDSLLAICRRK